MSPLTVWDRTDIPGFPRVSGDEPALGADVETVTQFSPRERG